jgi:hypothetical protein
MTKLCVEAQKNQHLRRTVNQRLCWLVKLFLELIMPNNDRLITFAEASQAGRKLASRNSSAPVKSNAGHVLACWRWQEVAG